VMPLPAVTFPLVGRYGSSQPIGTADMPGTQKAIQLPGPLRLSGRILVQTRPLHGKAGFRVRLGEAVDEITFLKTRKMENVQNLHHHGGAGRMSSVKVTSSAPGGHFRSVANNVLRHFNRKG